MNLKLWQVDAFASKPFQGNPAAIIPLETWIDDQSMQRIANENNLSETAYFVRKADGRYDLRWFTPASEVKLCGHATLASAWTIFEFLEPKLKQISFNTKSGEMIVERGAGGNHVMSLPSDSISALDDPQLTRQLGEALDAPAPALVLQGSYVVAIWNTASQIRRLQGPGDVSRVLRPRNIWGLIVSAPGDEGYDFVSRFFAPDKGVPEDPVTGSAHCALTPYWARRLGKKTLKARQVSPRGGDLICTDAGDRTILSGPCALYMTAEITI